jgi:TonB-dependent SusC/RagA subfamily outer membrane receptor
MHISRIPTSVVVMNDASRAARHPILTTVLGCTLCISLGGCASAGATAKPHRAVGDSTAADPIGSANSPEWQGRTVTRTEELFAGRFPGVQVYQTGGGLSVRIRGQSSVLGSNEPLYVVDGIPLEPSPNGLIALNPADIAKIQVLKDISSTAAYGVRGANGVILITTKRH